MKLNLNLKKIFRITLLGFLITPLGDYSHVLTHTLLYPKPIYHWYVFGEIPFWVFIEFGLAAFLIALQASFLKFYFYSRFYSHSHSRVSPTIILMCYLLFLGGYLLSGVLSNNLLHLNEHPLLTTHLVLSVLAFISINLQFPAQTKKTLWVSLAFYLVTAFFGTLTEITLSSFYIFNYLPQHQDLWGVPSWLPWLYIMAAHAIEMDIQSS
jgi:hypothetical protein